MQSKLVIDPDREKLIQEVIDVIDNPNFLAGLPEDMTDNNFITDINEAGFYYGRALYKGFEKKIFYYKWDDLYTFRWNSSLWAKGTVEKIGEYCNIIRNKVGRNHLKICYKAHPNKSSAYYEISSQAGELLAEIASYRALSRRRIQYYEDMLTIFRMGGFPCGWTGGRFPYEGSFKIFSLTDNPGKLKIYGDTDLNYDECKKVYDFGDNFIYIKEIVDLVQSDNFLKGINSSIEGEYQTSNLKKALNDYDKETHYLPTIFPNRKKRLTSMYKLDKHINENIIDNLINEHKMRYRIDDQVFIIMRGIMKVIEDKLSETNIWNELREYYIWSQLRSCLISKAIEGNNNLYYKRMLEVYKTGGWPCGFTGNWPDVKFKIYYPINESHHAK